MSKKVFHFNHRFNTDFNWSENIVQLDELYNGWNLNGYVRAGALCLNYFEKISIEINKAIELAKIFKSVVILKGNGTIITKYQAPQQTTAEIAN